MAGDRLAAADRDEAVGSDRLRLALQRQRLHLLDDHGVANQAVGRLPKQDLRLGCRLLQTGRDVHGVAGHQSLAGARVAGDDLAGIHAGAVDEHHSLATLELEVDALQGLLHVGRRADRPQRVVLVSGGQPEDRHHGIADELLDRAAVPLEAFASPRSSGS